MFQIRLAASVKHDGQVYKTRPDAARQVVADETYYTNHAWNMLGDSLMVMGLVCLEYLAGIG
jgi:hypothetical protein